MAIARALPGANADGAGVPARAGTYFESYVLPISNHELFTADEGTYFTAIRSFFACMRLWLASVALSSR
jgi:hypothetical protein